jgi:hypothetical protein
MTAQIYVGMGDSNVFTNYASKAHQHAMEHNPGMLKVMAACFVSGGLIVSIVYSIDWSRLF